MMCGPDVVLVDRINLAHAPDPIDRHSIVSAGRRLYRVRFDRLEILKTTVKTAVTKL